MKIFIIIILFVAGCFFAMAQLTPQQIINNSAGFQPFSDRGLEEGQTYLLSALGGNQTPSQVASNAAPFGGYSDRELQEADTYLLNQILANGTGGTSLVTNRVTLDDSFYLAVSNAAPGTIITFGPGVFIMTNYFKCPNYGGVIGAGKRATTLIDMYTNTIPYPLIFLSTNCVISGMTISNYYGDPDPAGGILAACVGSHRVLWNVGYTNARLENLELWGGSDTFYNRDTFLCTSISRNVDFHGWWDVCTAFEGTQQHTFIDCTFTNQANITHGNASDVFVEQGGVCVAQFVNCYLYSTRNNAFLISFQDDNAGSSLSLINTVLKNPDVDAITPGEGYYIYPGNDNALPVTLQNVSLNMAAVGASLSGAPTAFNLGTNVMQGIVFSGDVDDGIGTTLSGNAGGILINNTTTISGNLSVAGLSVSTFLNSPTNSGSGTFVDFSHRDHLLQTNASFAFRGFINITSQKSATEITWVTNTTGSAIVITPPAGTITNGLWLCTNLTKVTWDIYEKRFTNGYSQPMK